LDALTREKWESVIATPEVKAKLEKSIDKVFTNLLNDPKYKKEIEDTGILRIFPEGDTSGKIIKGMRKNPDKYQLVIKELINVPDQVGRKLDDRKLYNDNLMAALKNAKSSITKDSKSEVGSGLSNNKKVKPLYDTEIDAYMQPMYKYGFIGTYMADELSKIPNNVLAPMGAVILNTDPSSKQGTHWVSLMWDLRNKLRGGYTVHWEPNPSNETVYYYDSFGREPSDQLKENIDQFIERLKKLFNIDFMPYYSFNKCRQQDPDSAACGYYAMASIIDFFNGFDFNDNCCYEHTHLKDDPMVQPLIKDVADGKPPTSIKKQILK